MGELKFTRYSTFGHICGQCSSRLTCASTSLIVLGLVDLYEWVLYHLIFALLSFIVILLHMIKNLYSNFLFLLSHFPYKLNLHNILILSFVFTRGGVIDYLTCWYISPYNLRYPGHRTFASDQRHRATRIRPLRL